MLDVLSDSLEEEGIHAVCALIPDIEHGRVDLAKLLAEDDPGAIVFDVSAPYDRTWTTFREVSARPDVAGRPFILTTTNKRGPEEYTGPGVLELLLKPYDLAQFLGAVKQALCASTRGRNGKAAQGNGNNGPSA
jgi:CheY-like chemotaxis protein